MYVVDIKGIGSRHGYFCRPKMKSNQYFLNMRRRFSNFQSFLLNRKINGKFLLASLKTLIASLIKFFCSCFPPLSLVEFFQCTFMSGFRNNFQNHRRLSEQLLESQAAFGKPEQATYRITGRIFTISSGKCFPRTRKHGETLFWIFFIKGQPKKSENHQRSFKKKCFDFQDLQKNINFVTLSFSARSDGIMVLFGSCSL